MSIASDFRSILRWQGASASDLQEEITMMKQNLLLAENSPETNFFHPGKSAVIDSLKDDLQTALKELERAERREETDDNAYSQLSFEKLENVYFCSLLTEDLYRVYEFVFDNDTVIAGPGSIQHKGRALNCTKQEFLSTFREADLSQYRGSHEYSPTAGYPPFVLRLSFKDEEEPFVIRYWQQVPEELVSLGNWLRYDCFMGTVEIHGRAEWQ